MTNILIASDHKLFRESLTRLLSVQPFFHVTGVCADTHAAITIASREQPHLVLIDGSSDPLSAIQATKKIVASSTANVIAISGIPDSSFASHMLDAGALGYLTKQSLAKEIITAIQEVAKDNCYSCLDNNPVFHPVPTPKAMARIKEPATPGIFWHRILQFAN